MATHEANGNLPAPKFELGILLVHGIGAHRQSGDTIVRWGDVLLETIRRATKVRATVEHAGPGDWAGMDRLEAAIRLRAGDHTEGWLLREGWWADAFPAPSYRELVSWSMQALPWAIVTYIGGKYWLASSLHWKRRIPARAWLIGALVPALLFAPVLFVLLGLSLLLGLLPIPYVRTLVLAVQSRLTATAGDSLAFLESPIRAALIRACILDGLVRLKQLCKHTVIVAHSQGAAVVLDALGGFVDGEEPEPVTTSRPLPDALVTFGAGTNQLASQKKFAKGLPEKFGTNPAFRAVLAILATTLMILALPVVTRELGQGVMDNVHAALVVLVLLLSVPAFWALLMILGKKLIKDEKRQDRLLDILGLPYLVAVGVLVVLYAILNPIAWLWLYVFVGLFSFAGLVNSILSPGMEQILTASVRRPPGLARWDDLYASADPVPNGPTRPTGVSDTSIKIWNLGSPFRDHTAYWNNRDGFVLRVAKVCAETAQSPWVSELPGESESVDKRAAWRVGFLQIAQRSARLIWLVLLVVVWFWHPSIPVPIETTIPYSEFQQMMDAGKIKSVRVTNNYITGTLKETPPQGRDRFGIVRVEPSLAKQLEEHGITVEGAVENTFMPDWLPRAFVRFALLVTFILLAMWATSIVIQWLWNWWVRKEQEAVLAHEYPRVKGKRTSWG